MKNLDEKNISKLERKLLRLKSVIEKLENRKMEIEFVLNNKQTIQRALETEIPSTREEELKAELKGLTQKLKRKEKEQRKLHYFIVAQKKTDKLSEEEIENLTTNFPDVLLWLTNQKNKIEKKREETTITFVPGEHWIKYQEKGWIKEVIVIFYHDISDIKTFRTVYYDDKDNDKITIHQEMNEEENIITISDNLKTMFNGIKNVCIN